MHKRDGFAKKPRYSFKNLICNLKLFIIVVVDIAFLHILFNIFLDESWGDLNIDLLFLWISDEGFHSHIFHFEILGEHTTVLFAAVDFRGEAGWGK